MPGKNWTLRDIPSQQGRSALITGANSGIGFYTARELARKGAHILMGCRNQAKGDAALARLRDEVPDASAEIVLVDMASLDGIRRFADAVNSGGDGLDLLINNAGVMAPKDRELTRDGFEIQFGTNVLGHFALTALLLRAIEHASSRSTPRVVTIASIAHKQGSIHFDDLQFQQSYSPMGAYRQSKLANLMFALELDRRLRERSSAAAPIMSLAAHPGVANTNLFQANQYPPMETMVRRAAGVLIGAFLNTELQGSLPTLFAATSPEARSGGYYGPQGWQEMRGSEVGPAKIAPQAEDPEVAARLWRECERLTGITFL